MPMPIHEGSTLCLYCHAEGIPMPKVFWYFRKRSFINLNHQNSHNNRSYNVNDANYNSNKININDQNINEGNTLILKNISRNFSGIFECIANNSVPPAASRKIKVSIECKKIIIK